LIRKTAGEAQAKQQLLCVADQDVSLFSESVVELELLSFEPETLQAVDRVHQHQPSQSSFIYLYKAISALQDEAAAQQFLLREVSARPSLTALDTYLERQPVEKTNAEVRGVVRHTLQAMLARRDRYVCRNCGFRGNQMHWLCPKCKRWGEIRQRYGL
jgi:lipopolysaccharide biosynthesis regulator YciM